MFSCFPHVVNIACQIVIKKITDLEYLDDTNGGYLEYDPRWDEDKQDCIAKLRSLINAVYSNY